MFRVDVIITLGLGIISTCCERSLSIKVVCVSFGAYRAYLTYGINSISWVSNLNIYKSLIVLL